jgi:hypothetical protein
MERAIREQVIRYQFSHMPYEQYKFGYSASDETSSNSGSISSASKTHSFIQTDIIQCFPLRDTAFF